MELNSLGKIKQVKKAKRVGRGESSGKGKTSGKGSKGQKVRGTMRIGFEGGQLPLIKRLPFRRGVGNNLAKNTISITLDQLGVFASGETVDKETLVKKGLIRKTDRPFRIKIVSKGKLDKALKIKVAVTKEAKIVIEKANGTIETKREEKAN